MPAPPRTDLNIRVENLPLVEKFTLARGTKTSADVVIVELNQNGKTGRGEAVPYARYGETMETVTGAIEQLQPVLASGLSRAALCDALLPGAARNAVDCALWDLQAQLDNTPIWELLGQPPPRPLTTAYTISLDTPAAMAAKASRAAAYPLLKIKLGGADGLAADLGRLDAIRKVRPQAALMIDANEGWQADALSRHADQLASFNLRLIEQPLPEAQDDILRELPLPFCADESVHDRDGLDALVGKYEWLNIKLDKTGGLTEALALAKQAQQKGFRLMTGCMVASSLSILPAFLLAQHCELADLDGPLFLRQDRTGGINYSANGKISWPPDTNPLWGVPRG